MSDTTTVEGTILTEMSDQQVVMSEPTTKDIVSTADSSEAVKDTSLAVPTEPTEAAIAVTEQSDHAPQMHETTTAQETGTHETSPNGQRYVRVSYIELSFLYIML